MPEDYPLSIQNAILQWWRYWGFKDNPFATSDASDAEEEHILPFAFVDTGRLERIKGNATKPQTILFFAPRGCGKTAHRRKLESEACPARINKEILTVSYTEFSFWRRLPQRPLPEDHVSMVVFLALDSLFRTVAKSQKDQIKNLSPAFIDEFAFLCRKYSSGMLDQIRSDQSGVMFLPGIKNVESKDAFSAFLVRLQKAKNHKDSLRDFTYHDAAKAVVKLAQEFGLKAIYVLVDAVDEVFLDGISWMDCLEPLMSDLQLMNHTPGLAFKFFLPTEYKKELFQRGLARGDKLSYAELFWTTDDLELLLSSRLRAFNEAGVNSLRMMCEPQLATNIDHLLIEKSQYIPRNLLQLGQHLVAVHCQNPKTKQFLTYQDWQMALKEAENSAWFLKQDFGMPLLEISGSTVCIGPTPVSLTRQEFDFLWCLAENGGTSSKETIIEAVYEAGEGVSDNSLSSLVKRLREKLGDEPKNPRYLDTLPRFGFRLLNWKIKEKI